MSGTLIPLFGKQRFDFTWLGAGASQSIIIHPAVNVVPYNNVRLQIRFHGCSGGALVGTQTVVLRAYGTGPSDEDPAEFTKGTALMSVTLDSSSTIPSLNTVVATDPDGHLKIVLTFTQTGTGGTAFWVELSADLIARAN
jgi:hypothetical protein